MARTVTLKTQGTQQAPQQSNQPNMNDIASASLSALTAAQQAVEQAKAMLLQAGIQTGDNATPAANKSNKSNGSGTASGGRIASPEQMAIREEITQWCHTTPDLFTIKSMTDQLGKDRVQVRNAIAALEASGIVQRWAEKLPEGRGARELVYKPSIADVGL